MIMKEIENRQSVWWMWSNIAVIVFSAMLVLYPPVRHFGAFMIPFGLLMPIHFVFLIRRERAAGRANLSIGELYAQAKAGRRLRPPPLEIAATIALLLAVATLMGSH
jgi:hypothetical protein